MKGSKGYRASDASENPERGEVVLSIQTVQKMLPLVQRIMDDYVTSQKVLARLHPEEEILDSKKRILDWPRRQRRYRLKEELALAELGLQASREELESLGVVMLDPDLGRIGFPTMVNNRQAYFSWHPGEDGLHSWHFAEETECRPIPPAWLKEITMSSSK